MYTTDVYSLARVTADDLRWAEEPWRNLACHRATEIGPLQLAQLAELLGIGTHREMIRDFSLLAGESQEGPWVVSLPSELMSRVGELTGAEARDVALRWSVACQPSTGGTPGTLFEYLDGLGAFARDNVEPYALYIRQGAV
jgi:hypothetical protein